MRNLKNGLVFAMEEDAVAVVPETEMVPETQAEVETATAEVTEQVGEIENVEQATVDAEADAGTLGEIQETMQESVEKGEGLDETAAEIAEVAVEAICARLGVKSKTSVMPAMESFGSKSSRLAATKIAIESIGDKIRTIWEAILKAVKFVWEKIKSFWLALTQSRGQLTKHLEHLKKRVENLDDSKEMTEKTVKGGAASALSIDGKTDSKTALKVLQDSQKLLKGVAAASNATSSLAGKLVSTESQAAAGDHVKELVQKLTASMEPLGKVASHAKAADGASVTHYGNLVNGMSVGIASGSKEGETTFGVQMEENTKGGAKEATTLSKAEMMSVLDQALVLVKDLEVVDAIEKDLEKVSKACEAVTQAVLKGSANASAAAGATDEATATKKAAANIRSLNSMVAKFGSSLPGAAFKAAKFAGDYVVASLAAHGTKKEEKKEEKK